MNGQGGPQAIRRSMRIRALILIIATAGWLLPAGAFACPPHTAEADAHHDGHELTHAAGHHGDATHDHAAAPESQKSEPGAPTDAPTCCSDDTRTPTVLASVVDAKSRPKSISLALPSSLLAVPQALALPSAARLRLHQPPPLPYARTRRPLLI